MTSRKKLKTKAGKENDEKLTTGLATSYFSETRGDPPIELISILASRRGSPIRNDETPHSRTSTSRIYRHWMALKPLSIDYVKAPAIGNIVLSISTSISELTNVS